MQTFKRIIKWAIIIAVTFVAVNFANFYILASNYNDIEVQKNENNNISIAVNESKATYVNGYTKIEVTNNSDTEINNKYILLDGYSEYNNCLTNKYIKIDTLKAGETQTLQFNYKAQEVKKVILYVSDNKPEEEKYNLSEEIDKNTIFVGAIILLYLLG